MQSLAAKSEMKTDLKLFSGREQSWNFSHMLDLFQTSGCQPSRNTGRLPEGPQISLPKQYEFAGQLRSTQALLEDTDTFALLVIRDGELVYESYAGHGDFQTVWISWSIAKSVVSVLIGIALEEGNISSLDDPICSYVPILREGAYKGVSIRHILQMSSGIEWSEDYSDPSANVHGVIQAMSGKGSFNEVLTSARPGFEPGTQWRYCSADTQALGLLIRCATGRSLSSYLTEKLAEPLGFESRAHWIVDRDGTEMACGGLLLAARDFARIGELYRNKGKAGTAQIVPAKYIDESLTPAGEIFQPGGPPSEGMSLPIGYGLHWWLPWGDRGQFAAIGIYNQYIFVDPPSATVIVKLSANRRYGLSNDDAINRSSETLSFMRNVAAIHG